MLISLRQTNDSVTDFSRGQETTNGKQQTTVCFVKRLRHLVKLFLRLKVKYLGVFALQELFTVQDALSELVPFLIADISHLPLNIFYKHAIQMLI